MKPPKRLLDEGASDFERAVLRSGLEEPPPDRLLERTLTAVGVTTGVLAATAGTTQAAAAAAGGGKGASASWIWFLVKCLGVGAGAGVVAVGAVEVASPPPASTALQGGLSRSMVSAVAAAQTAAAIEAPPPADGPLPAPEPPAGAEPRTPPATGAPSVSASAPKSTSTLAAELALVDPARKALNAGDANRALRLLDQHAKDFPGGVLAQEAEIVRIHALFARGDRAAAADRAKRFLAQSPQSPHAERLRRIADPTATGDVAKP